MFCQFHHSEVSPSNGSFNLVESHSENDKDNDGLAGVDSYGVIDDNDGGVKAGDKINDIKFLYIVYTLEVYTRRKKKYKNSPIPYLTRSLNEHFHQLGQKDSIIETVNLRQQGM